MNPVERLSRIEVKRAKLVSRVGVMDRELRLAHPRPGKWSIREIIEHLVIAEEAVLGEVTRLAELAARPRAIRHRVRFPVVMFILRFDIPVQAPSRAMLPSGELTFCDIRERWQTNHDGLRRYLEGLTHGEERGAIFTHPVSGPMTIAQALWMLEVHLDRHIRQIDALERRFHEHRRAGSDGSGR